MKPEQMEFSSIEANLSPKEKLIYKLLKAGKKYKEVIVIVRGTFERCNTEDITNLKRKVGMPIKPQRRRKERKVHRLPVQKLKPWLEALPALMRREKVDKVQITSTGEISIIELNERKWRV